jgi:hypothetical protein
MNRLFLIFVLSGAMFFVGGCSSNYDILTTDDLKTINIDSEGECFYIEPLKTNNPNVGKVISDVIEREFRRRKLTICDRGTATIIVSGSTFMTVRAAPSAKELRGNKSAAANEAIDSISVKVISREGKLLAIASYDNDELYTVNKAAKIFGAKLAKKLKPKAFIF